MYILKSLRFYLYVKKIRTFCLLVGAGITRIKEVKLNDMTESKKENFKGLVMWST